VKALGNNDNNKMTNLDGYKLTAAEERLLEVLMNPNYYGKSITEKCQVAEISRETYYQTMRRPEFTDFYNQQIQANLKNSVGKIIQATENFATRFPGNHQDRKMLLEIAGAYTEKQQVEVTHGFESSLKDLLGED
jgi:hypothetical protein